MKDNHEFTNLQITRIWMLTFEIREIRQFVKSWFMRLIWSMLLFYHEAYSHSSKLRVKAHQVNTHPN